MCTLNEYSLGNMSGKIRDWHACLPQEWMFRVSSFVLQHNFWSNCCLTESFCTRECYISKWFFNPNYIAPYFSLPLSLSLCLQPYATEQFQLSQVSVYDLLKLLLFPEYLWNPFRGKFWHVLTKTAGSYLNLVH